MSNIVLPSSPKDQESIRNGIQEIVNCLLRIDAEKDAMKDILDTLKDKYEIPPKYSRKAATLIHKQNKLAI